MHPWTGATILLVHGAWSGEWVYWRLGPALDERGLEWVGTDLPTCRATDNSLGPLDDVEHVRDLVAGIDGPVIVVGKSYGGVVISGATAGCSNVQHLVYLAAMMPTADEPFQQTTAAAMVPEFAAGVKMLDDGRLEMDTEIGAAQAFSQASEDEKDMWRRHCSPMAFGVDPTVTLGQVGWTETDSTYIVCTEDKAIEVSAQRAWAANATNVIERPWDHSPGVSHPDELADLLAELAGASRPAGDRTAIVSRSG